jgi:hypothetical protein
MPIERRSQGPNLIKHKAAAVQGLLIVHAGGQAGLFSAICAGWTGGRFREESKPVTKEVRL